MPISSATATAAQRFGPCKWLDPADLKLTSTVKSRYGSNNNNNNLNNLNLNLKKEVDIPSISDISIEPECVVMCPPCETNQPSDNTNGPSQVPKYIVDSTSKTTYLKGKFLGKGGFARVYELRDLSTNQIYAGKIIPKSRITKPQQKEKIVREINLHKPLEHKNVVRFHHFFEDEENVYIILEYCPRKSLVHVLKNRKNLTEPEVRYYVRQLVEGVSYIHSQHVIHRDLKLGNMFLTEDMILKVGDFGLASRLDQFSPKTVTICGTPNYIAPEVLNKEGHGFEADIWALGCIMYALLVGYPPFETTTLNDTYARITANAYVIPPLISTPARILIGALLQPCPSHRPTLESILEFDFFKAGYEPNSLSSANCYSTPTFPVVNLISRCSTLPILNDDSEHVAEEMKRLSFNQKFKSHKSTERTKMIHSGGLCRSSSTKEVSTKKDKDLGFPSAIKLRITKVLCPDKLGLGRKSKPCSMGTLYHVMGTCLDNMPDDSSSNPMSMQCPILFVSKWIDYSNKYGFGFQLSDKSVSIRFNDGTKISFPPNKSRIEFHDVSGKITGYPTTGVPSQLQYRYTLLRDFTEYMDENLTEGGDSNLNDSLKRKGPIPTMKRWVRTSKAIVMQLSAGILQINFIVDHTKIILSSERQHYLVTYINENRQASTYSLLQLTQHGCDVSIRERLLYAHKVLGEFSRADQESCS